MSPVVLGGFAAIDAAVIAQIAYAIRDYGQRDGDESGHDPMDTDAGPPSS